MMINPRILIKLISVANQSICGQKMACVITDKRDNICSFSPNLKKSHPYQQKIANKVGLDKKIYLHSEIASVCRIKKFSNPYRAYIIRITSHGLSMAKPCPICRIALAEVGIFEIIYSINYNEFERMTK